MFGRNSELRAIAEYYSEDESKEEFVKDFAVAWAKVMNMVSAGAIRGPLFTSPETGPAVGRYWQASSRKSLAGFRQATSRLPGNSASCGQATGDLTLDSQHSSYQACF